MLHLFVIGMGAFPVLVDERGMDRALWQDPLAQKEFQKWSEQSQAFGVETTPEEVEEALWNFAGRSLEVQSFFKDPLEPWWAESGTRQRWRMFPAPVPNPVTFVVEMEQAGDWQVLYQFGSEDHQWLRRYFDRDRFRAAMNLYAWGLYPETAEEFVQWVGRRALEDHPNTSSIRVSFPTVPTLEPGETDADEESLPEVKRSWLIPNPNVPLP